MNTTTYENAQATARLWTIDKVHSTVRYEIEHNGSTTFRGAFKDVDASLEYGDEGVKISGSVRVDSVDLADETQKGHVLSPDFFDAERYPTIDYESTQVTIDGDEAVVDGTLTIRGESRPLTIRGKIGRPHPNIGGGQTLPISLGATINRQDYGVRWNAELPNGSKVLGDDVRVEVELELLESDR